MRMANEELAVEAALMAKATTLNAQDRVVLFCVAIGIDHAAVGIPDHDLRMLAGFSGPRRTIEVARARITEAGRRVLAEPC